LEALNVLAYGDTALRRPAADFLFAQYPPDADFANKAGVQLPHAWADEPGARVLQHAVVRLLDDADPFVAERGLILLLRRCLPVQSSPEEVRARATALWSEGGRHGADG
jgi:hypothetical protein